ncbi:PREDICTED: G2/mitotic-specific cyclin-B3-like [Amphimedon queenslandica]|uniref:G2/mitotic-specific cyclin-B3 n=1 Tax=Amphimedon queenslandica TaxID=400682 RepID=A0AAN0J1Q0_AMPQE|nr:PREDICTED: G2/mitotic-specific cyclin-B3-like [Amphimedon queenslandica]|eukprot:XP_019850667.1 PREDICTED: G2/mitotic-specific cyclin-B3-like [Amphimedon queenslandica]
MERAKRTSSLKALQAIKENSHAGRNAAKLKKIESEALAINPTKRHSSPTAFHPPEPKRNPLGNVTNVSTNITIKPKQELTSISDNEDLYEQAPRRSKRLLRKNSSSPIPEEPLALTDSLICSESLDTTPMTDVQNVLRATTLDDKLEESQLWKDIDEAESHDPLFSSEYAPDIYQYMREREVKFKVSSYLDHQPLINSSMRSILIDWLVEVQENFELFHETLYLAVKIVDRYLEKKEVKKEYLQLVGATSMLIAAKFEELSPPLVDDFIYLCDDAYQHDELLSMERNILATLEYDVNAPVAYRFLRRLARAAGADMETHTLARYICESTLQEYEFVSDDPSHIAGAAMYLSIRMKGLGGWTPTLQHYSQYEASNLLPMVQRLNDLISRPAGNTSTVRSKYSHEVFHKVALILPLQDVHEDYLLSLEESS